MTSIATFGADATSKPSLPGDAIIDPLPEAFEVVISVVELVHLLNIKEFDGEFAKLTTRLNNVILSSPAIKLDTAEDVMNDLRSLLVSSGLATKLVTEGKVHPETLI